MASHDSQRLSREDSRAVEVQEVDSWRTHVTETQLPLSQGDLQEEELWEEQQARLEPTTMKPGNKILRPLVDDVPFDEGFQFKQAKDLAALSSTLPQRNASAPQALHVSLPQSDGLLNGAKDANQISTKGANQAANSSSEDSQPAYFSLPRYEGSLKSRAKYFDLTGKGKSILSPPTSLDSKAREDSYRNPIDKVKSLVAFNARTVVNSAGGQTSNQLENEGMEDSRRRSRVQGSKEDCNEPNVSPILSVRGVPTPITRPMRAQGTAGTEPPTLGNLPARTGSAQSKVTKKRSKPQEENVLNSEQLLRMFMFRRRKEEEEWQLSNNELEQQQAHIASMAENITTMEHSLRESHHQCKSREDELNVCQQKLTKFKERAMNLQKFIDGLSRDHQKLHGDMQQLKMQLQNVVNAKSELESTISDERVHYENMLRSKRKSLAKANRIILELEVQSLQQEQDLVNHNELIDAEQQRHDMLEQEFSTISATQTRMVEKMTANQDKLMEKLASVPNTEVIKEAIVPVTRISPESIISTLQNISRALDALKNRPDASVEGIKDVGRNVAAHANRLAQTLRDLQSQQKTFQNQQSKETDSIGQQLSTLNSEVQSERKVSQTIAELRETKASLEEQVGRKNGELATLASRYSDLEDQDRRKHSDIMALNEQVAAMRARQEVDRTLLEKLQESENLRQGLQTDLAGLQGTLKERQLLIQDCESGKADLQQQFERLNEDFKSVEDSLEQSRTEKDDIKADMSRKFEVMRREVIAAAETEKSSLIEKHADVLFAMESAQEHSETTIQKLRADLTASSSQRTEIEAQLQSARQEVSTMSNVNKSQEQKLQAAQSQLQVLKESSEANDTKAGELGLRLETTMASNANLTMEIESLKQALSKEQSAVGRVLELEKQFDETNNERLEYQKQIVSLKAALKEMQSKIGSIQDGQSLSMHANVNVQEKPSMSTNLSTFDRTLGSLLTSEESRAEVSQELPYYGKKRMGLRQDALAEEAQDPVYGQPLESLYENMDLITTADEAQDTGANLNREFTRPIINQKETNAQSDLGRNGVGRECDPMDIQRHAEVHLSSDPGSLEGQKQHAAPLHPTRSFPPSTPQQSSQTHGQESERRSNSSVRRTPMKVPQHRFMTPKAGVPQIDHPSKVYNAKIKKFTIDSLSSERPSSQTGLELASGKRKRQPEEADKEPMVNSRTKLNKFTKTGREATQFSANSPGKRAPSSGLEAIRRAKPRVSSGEIRSLGPIIGSQNSPTKSISESQNEGHRKKSQRKSSDKWSKKFNTFAQQ